MVSSGGRYTAISPRNTRFLPLMKPTERITVRKAVCCGYLASRKGTAMKLSLSDSHSKADTAVRNSAFAARKTSAVRSLPRSSIYAHAPKNMTGTSPRSPRALVHRAAEMLRLKVRFFSNMRENGTLRLRGCSEVMTYSS